MSQEDYITRLLRRVEDLQARFDAYDPGQRSCPGPVVLTTTTLAAYPTTAKSFFAANPATLSGTELEGNVATIGSLAGPCFVANIGSGVPVTGTPLIAELVDGFWVTQAD